MAKKQSEGTGRVSSGHRKRGRLVRAIHRLEAKIRRWERYKDDPTKQWSKPRKPEKGSPKPAKKKKWDTSGLKREVSFMKDILKRRS